MDESNIDIKEKSVKKIYVNIYGEDFKAQIFLDFLDKLLESNSMFSVTWERKYEDLAEVLIDKDLVVENTRGSWFVPEDRKSEVKDLYEHTRNMLYEKRN
jgi:hypothetical protein